MRLKTPIAYKPLRIGKWPALMLVLAVAAAIVVSELSAPIATVGKAAPGFALPDIDGRVVALSDYKGRVVMLNFWASWCDPCREETPALQSFAARYGHKVAVLGVNYQESPEQIRSFSNEFGITYPILRDADGKVAERYQMKALPESWFIDESGIARIYWIGPMTFEQMRAAYQSVTGESIDGSRLLGDAKRIYRLDTHDGLSLRDGDQTWRSADGGATWTFAASRADAPSIAARARDIAWAGKTALAWVEGEGMYRTVDGGRQWRLLAQTAFDAETPEVALALSSDGKRAWAGNLQGLFTSDDAGETWKKLSFPLTVNGLAAGSTQPGRLFIATDRGIWSSADGGATFALSAGSPARSFDDVAVAQIDGVAAVMSIAPNGDVYKAVAGDWTLLNPS